ncbi:MAG: phosphatidylserine decarboxylase [Comamonas sp.]|nr:phosphatidylserine decarboxylase [Comamonas sp.]
MSDRLSVLSQYFLPKQALTRVMGRLANLEGGATTTAVIRWFIERYKVDMSEALNPDPAAYATFNSFFTRELKADARPVAQADWICPVDGAVSQLGAIAGNQIFQAKRHSYSTQALVGGDAALAAQFQDGNFATIYLSPRDYHRIHMPCAGRLLRMIHIPGELFSVNPATARGVPGLFARNERLVCVFDGPHGLFIMVLVGATVVGSMATVWHGVVNPPRPGKIREWDYREQNIQLPQGAEMGRFLLGSTIVLLTPRSNMQWNSTWQAATPVRLGQMMADQAP